MRRNNLFCETDNDDFLKNDVVDKRKNGVTLR